MRKTVTLIAFSLLVCTGCLLNTGCEFADGFSAAMFGQDAAQPVPGMPVDPTTTPTTSIPDTTMYGLGGMAAGALGLWLRQRYGISLFPGVSKPKSNK